MGFCSNLASMTKKCRAEGGNLSCALFVSNICMD